MHHSDPSVTHRDLRPDTVFIASTGTLKVACFSRCALRTPTSGCTAADCLLLPLPAHSAVACADGDLAEAAEAARGVAYTAPELVRDGACADPAVDVYAAAAIISYLRTGRDPADASLCRVASAPPVGCLPLHPGRQKGSCWGRCAGAALAAAAALDPAERPAADALVEALEVAARRRGHGACRMS
jgi:serine/threonine protein kinase